VAVITISKDAQGNTVYDPQSITIKTGDEILILNNEVSKNSPFILPIGVVPNSIRGLIYPKGNEKIRLKKTIIP
jgi:hypothetical protein